MTDTATQERAAATEEQPVTQQLPAVRPRSPRGRGGISAWLHEALVAPLEPLRRHGLLLGIAAAIAAIVALLVTGSFSNLFPGARASLGPPPGIIAVGSSWVTGEPSLADSPLFQAIENRAAALAASRWAAREQLIAAIIAAKKAAAARKRADLLKKYEELRAKELAAYQAKLRAIEKLRAAELAKQRAAELAYKRKLAAYMRARTVTPGQECGDPTVAQYYSCQNGLLPASHRKGH